MIDKGFKTGCLLNKDTEKNNRRGCEVYNNGSKSAKLWN